MKAPGSVYIGNENRKYVATYITHHPDIYRAAPPCLKDAERIAHIAYDNGGRSNGIDVFLIGKESKLNSEEMDIKRYLNFQQDNLKKVDREQNIHYKIERDFALSKQRELELLYFIRRDVKDYCEWKAKTFEGSKIIHVDKIIPEKVENITRYINQKFLLKGGKQDFVDVCSLDANLDFSWGCISGFVNNFLDVFAECKYCYASFQHTTFAKNMIDVAGRREQLRDELLGNCYLAPNKDPSKKQEPLGRPVRTLRLGKRTECGSKYTLDHLIATLEVCAETRTRTVMPTKALEFNKEIAKLEKRTKSSVLYSIGFDELERGACSHGWDNKFRMEQAVKYREAGVNSSLYLMIDAHHAPKKRELDILEFAKKYNLNVQLLSIVIPSKNLAEKMTGMSWEDLKRPAGFFSKINGGYNYLSQGKLRPQKVHKFYLNLVKNNSGNIRMCHHDERKTYCGNCFLRLGIIAKTKHKKIEYSGEKRGGYKRRNEKRRKLTLERQQASLFEEENSIVNENGQ
jgi:hypothetical protein